MMRVCDAVDGRWLSVALLKRCVPECEGGAGNLW